jgi:hypothetical protein
MFRKIFLLFCLFIISIYSIAQKRLPSIEEVATKFYNTYDIYSLEYPMVAFEKRGNLWKVTTKKWQKNKLVKMKSYLFFDGATNNYSELPIAQRTDTGFVNYKDYVDDYDIRLYLLNDYYGYEGWYKDIITAFEGKQNLPDTPLYSLARAYSMHATSLLHDQLGSSIDSEVFKMPFTANCMTPEQRKQYSSIMKKSIAAFSLLSKQNRNFETVVGNIAIKHAHENITEFYAYLTYADEYAKTFQLPANLYPDSIIQQTKKRLSKCPKNAILLSWGDNDFYPVFYVQHKLGFRQDIYLVNTSLLGLDRYIFRATHKQFMAEPIKISVGKEHYLGDKNNYLYVEKDNMHIPSSMITDIIKKRPQNFDSALTVHGNHFTINSIQKNKPKFSIERSYIDKGQWILVDIMNHLNGRKICTSNYMFYDYKGLEEYFTKIDDDLFVF